MKKEAFMPERFERMQMLVGASSVDALARKHVAVFGIGGVGGFVAEALARCGIGALTLVDPDVVAPSNVNRQIVALTSTLGMPKVKVMAARVADINPSCKVAAIQDFCLPATVGKFDFAEYDYVVDAVDTVTGKLLLAECAQNTSTPFISCMGTANKLDPTALLVADISETVNCPFARIIRKECRKRGLAGFKVVYSPEKPRRPYSHDEAVRLQIEANRLETGRRDIPGSIAFVPSVAGMILASEVVKDLLASE